MKTNLNINLKQPRSMIQLFVSKFVPKIDLYIAIIMTIATYIVILLQFPPSNPSFLKDVCGHIAMISANLWAIVLAALVIAIPQIDKERNSTALKRFAAIIPTLFLCMVLSSSMYFYAAFHQGTSLLSILILAPVTCLFYYAIMMSFIATVQILKDYI